DAIEPPDELLDLLGDLRPDWAAGVGEREGHVDGGILDLDLVHQPQRDEVEPQLGVDDLLEGFIYVVLGDGRRVFGSHGIIVARWCAARLIYALGNGTVPGPPLHRLADRRAVRDHQGRRGDRRPADDRAA